MGQCVCDTIDKRHKGILPARLWGDGDPEGVRQRCAEEIKNTAKAAKLFGVKTVNGFTGSSVWGMLYFFPPTGQADIEAGYEDFAARWLPILDAFQAEGVRFALEVHPTEIAYDIYTAQRALEAVNNHPAFGFNFDPSHFIHQFINPVVLPRRVPRSHLPRARQGLARSQLNGRNSILSSHLDFGDPRRGWDFVSPGRGDVKWDPIIRALNRIGYQGPLSIEWEDSGMDRERGAPEALAMIRKQDFAPSTHGLRRGVRQEIDVNDVQSCKEQLAWQNNRLHRHGRPQGRRARRRRSASACWAMPSWAKRTPTPSRRSRT